MEPGFPPQQGEGSGPRRGFRGTDGNKNTRLCMRWANGDCRFGDRCNFAHGEQELRAMPAQGDAGYGRGGGGGYGAPRGGYGGGRGYGGRGGGGWDDGYGGGGGYDAGGYGGGGYGGGGGYPQMQGAPGGGRGPYAAGGGGPPDDVYARQGFPVQGPNGWVAYKTQDSGEVYYHNHSTQVTQWDRPAEWPSGP